MPNNAFNIICFIGEGVSNPGPNEAFKCIFKVSV